MAGLGGGAVVAGVTGLGADAAEFEEAAGTAELEVEGAPSAGIV